MISNHITGKAEGKAVCRGSEGGGGTSEEEAAEEEIKDHGTVLTM